MLAALALAPAAHAHTMADLAWLKGCWRTEAAPNGNIVTEVWTAPPAGAMFGYAYTIRDGQPRGWEQMRIEADDGALYFVALLPGQDAVRFRLHYDDDPHVARFENPEHDYPQRVEYRRDGDQLTGTISRVDGGDAFSFGYRRVDCDASLQP